MKTDYKSHQIQVNEPIERNNTYCERGNTRNAEKDLQPLSPRELKQLNGLLAFPIVFFLLLTPVSTFAIEGTCSWHGGINCAAGADWDGSAVCVDGWRDSSEQYYDQKMCTDELHHCSTNVASKLNVEYSLDALGAEVSRLCTIDPSTMILDTDDTSTMRDKTIVAIKQSSECSNAQAKFASALLNYKRDCYAIGEKEYRTAISELASQYTRVSEAPKYTCPANSYESSPGKCNCNSGYVVMNNQCVKQNVAAPIVQSETSSTIICNGQEWSKATICNPGYVPYCVGGTSVACKPSIKSFESTVTEPPLQTPKTNDVTPIAKKNTQNKSNSTTSIPTPNTQSTSSLFKTNLLQPVAKDYIQPATTSKSSIPFWKRILDFIFPWR